MRKILLACTLVFLVAGCASVNKVPLSGTAAQALQGQTIVQTSRKLPDFAAMSPGKAAFAILGAVAMISEGNKIIETNKVADPAVAIGDELAAALAAKYAGQVAPARVPVTADDAPKLAREAQAAGPYVLDVQTINWTAAYFPTSWGRYRLIYVAKARLINTRSGQVVAEGFCRRVPESEVGAPSYEELMGAGATMLKSELAKAAAECAATLKAEMLNA